MSKHLKLFLAGDVMTGRGVDQILPHPGDPELREPHVTDATHYVALAEQAHGSIPRPVEPSYVWGVALEEFTQRNPDFKIMNLETSITTNDEFAGDKRIHYRMNPANTPVLQTIGVDACNLANNHVLDFGRTGLLETLTVLETHGIHTVGAGRNLEGAREPVMLSGEEPARVRVFGCATKSSGVPASWAARRNRPGVCWLTDLTPDATKSFEHRIRDITDSPDVTVVSVHWGGNWGYKVPEAQVNFAHRLVERANVDIVHGHSSHHVKGIEVHQGRLILYGCGDWLTDYEGIRGREEYRDDLGLMYFPVIDADSGSLRDLAMVPSRIKNMRLIRPSSADVKWIGNVLSREGTKLGTDVDWSGPRELRLRW